MKFTKISAWLLILGVFFLLSESCVAQKKGKKKKKGKVEEVVKEEPKEEVNPFNEFGCARFGDDKQKTLESASLYTEFYKQKDYDSALPHWRYVFDNAPGLRQNTFVRGENMYKEMIEAETDETKREELIAVLFEIIEKRGDCWGQKGSALGRKAFYIASYYEGRDQEVFDLFDEAMEVDGNNTDPEIFPPYLGLLYNKVRAGEVEKSKFDALLQKANGICDHNISNNTENVAAYQAAKDKIGSFQGNVATLEDLDAKNAISDCASCKAYYQPKLQADPNSLDIIKSYYATLAKFECKKDPEYYRMIVKRADIDPDAPRGLIYTAGNIKYKEKDYQGAKAYFNRALTMYSDDPATQSKIRYTLGNLAYSEKNYAEARNLYNAALPGITDNEKKGKVKMKLANIAYRNDKDFPTARNLAEEAAALRPNWGDPYMLIGQLYASSGKKCGPGTGWDSQVVTWCAVDAWYKAKKVDPSVAEKAQSKINKYSAYFPAKDVGFMKGYTNGQSYTVGCWIQRSTTVRLK